jgi:hypothetical protein
MEEGGRQLVTMEDWRWRQGVGIEEEEGPRQR